MVTRTTCVASRMIFRVVFLFFAGLLITHTVFAAVPSTGQQIGAEVRSRELQEQSKRLREEIEKPRQEKVLENVPQQVEARQPEQKILVKKIQVEGVTLFLKEKIASITSPFENKELTFSQIQNIADQITQLYRIKGYVISRAYVPPQDMKEGVLEIKVLEARIGDIQLKGNHFYSTKLIESYLTIRKGEIFNSNDLKHDINVINDHPDRTVRAVLLPGKEPGSTDIILNEEDSLPIHVSAGYNNYLSRNLGGNIYNSSFTDNNFLGRDDVLSFQYERGDANAYYSYKGRYVYPVTRGLDLGVYAGHSRQILGGEFADIGARGKSRIFGLTGAQQLIRNDDLTSRLNFGFEYKDIYNFLNGDVSSRDRLRVASTGFDIDFSDDWGRTIVIDDLNWGIPEFLAGTPRKLDPNGTPTSRAGSSGGFFKNTLNLVRLQRLIYNMTLFWSNQLQFSNSKLPSSEQFQIGGPQNNRGYSAAELVGDQGYSMSWELAQPLYFIPQTWRIPFSNQAFYDAFRFFEFYDWGNVHLNSIQPGEEKNRTLRSAGFGARLSILKNFYGKYEIGWPLDNRPADGKGLHQWLEFTLTF